jgi:hypothetical protein
MGHSFDVSGLITQLLARHLGCIQINGACLISPQGLKVLISGGADTGCNAIAAALVFGRGWKLIANGVTLIDPEIDQIASFLAPFFLKSDLRKLIEEVQISLPHFILHEWLPLSPEHAGGDYQASFELVVFFDGETGNADFSCSSLTGSQCLRRILSTSNLAAVSGGIEKFTEYINAGSCYQFSNGNVKDRLDKLSELCEELTARS